MGRRKWKEGGPTRFQQLPLHLNPDHVAPLDAASRKAVVEVLARLLLEAARGREAHNDTA